jgi:hypothetical protein
MRRMRRMRRMGEQRSKGENNYSALSIPDCSHLYTWKKAHCISFLDSKS